jgi:hypothetical protein
LVENVSYAWIYSGNYKSMVSSLHQYEPSLHISTFFTGLHIQTSINKFPRVDLLLPIIH